MSERRSGRSRGVLTGMLTANQGQRTKTKQADGSSVPGKIKRLNALGLTRMNGLRRARKER